MLRAIPIIGSILTAVLSTSANAQERPESAAPARPAGDRILFGLGAGITPSYDGAGDYKIIPGGVLSGTVAGHDFQLNGPQLFVDAIPNRDARKIDLELGPVVGLRLNRTSRVDDARITALGKLETAVELGLRGSIGLRGVFDRTDRLALAATAAWDVAGAHGSHIVSPSVEYSRLASRRVFVRAALTSEFVGGGYADYNFGVTPGGAAASGLSRYRAKGGLASIGANMLVTRSIGRPGGRWSVFGIASYKRLQGDVAASPIVVDTGSPNQFFAAGGIAYSF